MEMIAKKIFFLMRPYLGRIGLSVIFISLGIAIFLLIRKILRNRKKAAEAEELAPETVVDKSTSIFSLRRSFGRGINFLKSNIGSQFYRKTPWFIILGESGSGKTTLLRDSGLNLPISHSIDDAHGREEGCKWWFFDQGVILDILGDFILRKDGKTSDQKGWDSFLWLLRKYRPHRPIDGVILTIPCTELIGTQTNQAERISQAGNKAAEIYDKLFTAQKILGIRFPIYLLVTQCDQIRGFKSFCQEMPSHLHNNIFGWSSPYTLETAYNPEWAHEAFQSIYKDLYKTQIEVVVDGIQVKDSDSFFMFPSEFSSMSGPISNYLKVLFKQSVYHEPFYFRGLYFCGNGLGEEASWLKREAAAQAPEASSEQLDASQPEKVFFLRDLFERKIFPEYQLARPTEKIFRAMTRTSLAIRGGLVALASFWILGMYFSQAEFYKSESALIPLLQDLKKDLTELKLIGTEVHKMRHGFLDIKARHLLKGMAEIQSQGSGNRFSSIFIPSSLGSNIDKQIERSMVLAYDKIILKSIFFRLQHQIENIIDEDNAFLASQREKTGEARQLMLQQTPEFIHLQNLLDKLSIFKTNIQDYNSLSTSEDLKALGNLVKYLFKTELPPEFYKNAYVYHQALGRAKIQKLNLSASDLITINKTIKNVSDRLYKNLFKTNPLLEELENFIKQINSFQDLEKKSVAFNDKVETFNILLANIEKLEEALARPENTWLAHEKLNLGTQFEKALLSITTSPLLGPKLAKELEDRGQKNFQFLKTQLREQKTELTGSIIAARDDRIQMQLSQPILKLKTSLGKFLNQSFMVPVGEKQDFVSVISSRNRIIWDESLLDSAIKEYRLYDQFKNNHLSEFPKQLQPSIRETALSALETHLFEYIGKAQNVRTLPSQSVSFLRREEDLSFEIRNFRKNSQRLGRLIDIFNSLDFTNSSWILSKLITSHAFYLLSSVNQLLEDDRLYNFKGNNFSWWSGQGKVSLAAYEVRDNKELSYYLSVQRDRIRHLAQEYAEPLLMFLVNRTINRDSHDERLVSKWQRVLRELDFYDSKKTGNSLAQLENFILLDMGKANLGNCNEVLKKISLDQTSGDFFESKYLTLRNALLDQCLNLSHNKVFREYSVVETFFNQHLAGRFPFIDDPSQPIYNEAEPEQIKKFYWLLDGYLKNQIQYLEQTSEFGLSGDQALAFLYQLEKVRPFFESFLNGKKSFQIPLYFLNVDFRVNKNSELRGNQIIDWEFKTGGQQSNSRMKDLKPLEWKYGQPIKITLRWAKDGPYIPVDVVRPEGEILDRTVTYEFNNLWSLPRLLTRFMAGSQDFKKPAEEQPHTLRFSVQTREWNEEEAKKDLYLPKNEEARFFIRLEIKNPEQKTLIFPQFTGKAPHLIKENLQS